MPTNGKRDALRVCIVGGIFGKDHEYRRIVTNTPETTLAEGLRAHGIQIRTAGHRENIPFSEFHVVHVHHLGFGALRAAADGSKTAFVFTSHDPFLMSGLQSRSQQVAYQFVMNRADALVALSERECAFQQKTYRLNGALHRVIPNGLDAALFRFEPRRIRLREQPWQLLFVGQLVAVKCVDVLLAAMAKIPHPAELSLIYQVDQGRQDLEEQARALGLTGRLRFMGARTPAEVAQALRDVHVLILPSEGESLPSVVTEAMLCGTPVVATEIGGVREQLGGYGVLVPPGNAEALAQGITRMLDSYESFAAQGEAMSRSAQERFSIQRMVEKHIELYCTLVERGEPRRRHQMWRVPGNFMTRQGVKWLCRTN